jgi:hypothetical protein
MPDESCRKCGGALELVSKCSDCRKPLEQFCANCKNVIADQVHACISDVMKYYTPKITWAVGA